MTKPLPLVTRLTRQIRASGNYELGEAQEVARDILRERGHMHVDSDELTTEGKRRQAMGPAGRAIDRAAKASGRPASDFKYVRGRAILK